MGVMTLMNTTDVKEIFEEDVQVVVVGAMEVPGPAS